MKNIGIDIGASHICCGLYNNDTEKLENKIYTPYKAEQNTDLKTTTKRFINIIINLIDNLLIKNNLNITEISSIGLGCPGHTDNENGIFYGSSSLKVDKVNLRESLKKYNTKVFIENDCTCAAICESYFSHLNNFLMFTLGTHVGIAYMQNYKCINQIVWDIIKINKDKVSNVDKYIKSFNNLSQEYNKIKNGNYVRWEIFESIKNGDLISKVILNNYIENFCIGISKVLECYRIKDIVIGGGISEYSKYFINDIKNNLQNVNIHVAKYFNDSGIIGAALLEKNYDERK